jgi:hypothetical protein
VSEASVMFMLFLGSYVILEDVFQRLKNLLGIRDQSDEDEVSASWRAAASAAIVLLATASHSLLHDILGDLVVHQGLLATARLLIYTYALVACCLLWGWIRGAMRHLSCKKIWSGVWCNNWCGFHLHNLLDRRTEDPASSDPACWPKLLRDRCICVKTLGVLGDSEHFVRLCGRLDC